MVHSKKHFLSETFLEQSLLVIVKLDKNKLLFMKMPQKVSHKKYEMYW